MLSKFSVRKPFTVLVAVVICLVLGVLSFQNMSTDFLPNMEFPYALVMTTYPGASPEEVEKAVSEPVEQAMERINNVKELQSISIQNMSMVVMSFNDGTDMGLSLIHILKQCFHLIFRFQRFFRVLTYLILRFFHRFINLIQFCFFIRL